MYFTGKLTIDPSHLTQIDRIPPKKAFRRMLYHLTSGAVSDKLERETFTAVSILQQLNAVMLSNGIDNMVRLSHDDLDFYLDTEGKKGDLKEAFDRYELEIDHAMSTHFDRLSMVLEHEDETFKYLIEVEVNRTHALGHYPVEIAVSGLLKQFRANGSEADAVRAKMEGIFSDQASYDAFLREHETRFVAFLEQLQHSIKVHIKVDDVQVTHHTSLVIAPKAEAHPTSGKRTAREGARGVHYDYHGFDDWMFYTFLWSTALHQHNVHIHDTHLVNDLGEDVATVDAEGLQGGEASVFDPEASYDDRLAAADELAVDTADAAETGGNWFDFDDSDSGGWFDFGDSGDSSCASCASCGGE